MKVSPFLVSLFLATSFISTEVSAINIRTINFKTCVEGSKIGKQEQSSFDALKKQMEGVLAEKEKTLNEMATKFEDPDYLDSLSPEAETELKRKFRTMNQEISQLQGQYYQALQQTNFKVIQQLTEKVTKAAKKIASDEKIDLVLNDEGCFFANPDLDISQKVIKLLDENFEKEGENKETTTPEVSTPEPTAPQLSDIKVTK